MIFLGVDPGVTGAVCMLNGNSCDVHDLPVLEIQGRLRKSKVIDDRKLHALLSWFVPEGPVIATVEDVFTIPGMQTRASSSDSLVKSCQAIVSVCMILGFTVQKVRPQTWQRMFGLKGADKSVSIETAKRLYPSAPLTLAKHHNRAESVLIAHWARRTATP